MRAISIFFSLIVFISCREIRTLSEHHLSNALLVDRLVPLSYADSKQSLKVWFSGGSSINLIYAINLENDSSSSGDRIEIGQKHTKAGKRVDHLSHTSFLPSEGIGSFFRAWDNLGPFQYKDQTKADFEIVYDSPLHLVIVEYLKDGKYTIFRFQEGSKAYRTVEEFLKARQITRLSSR